MKRKVLCFFSLLLILLVFFTIVSPKVEDEMYTLVDARKGEGKGNRNISVGTIAIVWENSNDKLFSIVEGDGWESGLRLAEIPSAYFDRYESHVELGAGTEYWYVYSASREPVLGSAVSVVETKSGEDTYLLWAPEPFSTPDKLPNHMDVVAHIDNVALISSWGATFPFFEHNIWYTLRNRVAENVRVYSLHDVQQFTRALPWIAGIAAVLVVCLMLWIASFLLPLRKGALWVNGLLITGSLGSLFWLTTNFDLPASLMPKESILDISHYLQTFERIFSSLGELGSNMLQGTLSMAMSTCTVVLSLALLLTALLIAVEVLISWNLRKKEEQE